MQSNARTVYALSRDGLLPDRGLFARMAPNHVPCFAVGLVVGVSALLGLLNFASCVDRPTLVVLTFASDVALNAICASRSASRADWRQLRSAPVRPRSPSALTCPSRARFVLRGADPVQGGSQPMRCVLTRQVLFRDHPEVNFKPGPFTLGRGFLGKAVNLTAVIWIRCASRATNELMRLSFVCVM